VRRRLLTALGVLVVLLAAAALALHGYGRGWFVRARSADKLASELRDRVFAPAGPGPFPAVILLHGCGGDPEHQQDWSEFFARQGLLARAIDSYSGRGISPEAVCGGRALLPAVRAADALVALDSTRRDPRVDPSRVVLVGWSHGASSLIELLEADPPHEDLPALLPRQPPLGLEGLAGVVLIYPYCGLGMRHGPWRSEVPVLMLLAERDTIADPAACLDLAAGLRGAGRPIEVAVYPGAGHGFDFRAMPANSGLPPPDPELASRAEREVLAFLHRVLRLE
jgi:dienelactone hydrolase